MSAAKAPGGWRIRTANEWTAHDPFGKLKPADASPGNPPHTSGVTLKLRTQKNAYVSFRLLVEGRGEYRVGARANGGLSVDLYKAWYHRIRGKKEWLPDALIPVRDDGVFVLPDADNDIPGQSVQEFWVDVFVPPDARTGEAVGAVTVQAGGTEQEAPFSIEILERMLPDEPCIRMDHNSYGCRWLQPQYPKLFSSTKTPKSFWNRTIEALHDYYRLFHEHRGTFHNLGYGHSGAADAIYAPGITGSGRGKNLAGWELFDRHYGHLLDGSAFRKAAPDMPRPRRPAAPVWGIYTPINPDWPASYLWWGEKGYETEFVRCLRQFDAHFIEKGWIHSKVEFFFNHKKRYRWFEWDGDEPKYAKDEAYHLEMGRLLKTAAGASPVKWSYRMDASWQMKGEFERLAGCVDFWVCGGFVRWYPEEVRRVLERGDTVWWYGGAPPVNAASDAVLENVYKTWGRGLNGFCTWLAVAPGADPWFDCDGSATGLLYPGERFGIEGPLPSIRLKIERNGIQDVDALNAAPDAESIRRNTVDAIAMPLWEKPPAAALELPPEDWDNNNLATSVEPGTLPPAAGAAGWWSVIRKAAVEEAY